MGNKKNIIQMLIIVVAFAAAGFVLYKGGIFGNGSGPASAPAPTSAQVAAEVLPYGEILRDPKDLDKVILPRRFFYDQVQYPKLNNSTEVGVDENTMIIPPVGP